MNKLFFDNKINLLFLLISLLCLVSLQGMENISPLSIKWTHTIDKFNRDSALYQSDNEIIIDFNFKNPVSPYEVLESPDARKLGILIKNIKITPV